MTKTDFSSSTSRHDKFAFLLPLFSDDTMAPLSYLAIRRKFYVEPEEKLLFALLNDAVYCFQHHFGARSRTGTKLFFDAEQWLMQRSDDSPFSFENVCEHLGIEPNLLRGELGKTASLPRWRMWRYRTDTTGRGTTSGMKTTPNSMMLIRIALRLLFLSGCGEFTAATAHVTDPSWLIPRCKRPIN